MTLESYYFALGPDAGLKADFYQQVKEEFCKRWNQPDVHIVFAGEQPVEQFLALVSNGDLFSDGTLVKCYNPEQWRKSMDQKMVLGFLAKIPANVCIVFMSEGVQAPGWLKKLAVGPKKLVFWGLFDNQKRSWIESFFKSQSKPIEPDAIELMLDVLSDDSGVLKQFCSHIAAMTPEGGTIDVALVENYVFLGREESPYAIFDQLARKRFRQALEKVQSSLLREESAVGIITVLLWQFRKLQQVQLAGVRRGDEHIFSRLGIRGKRQQELFISARSMWSSAQVDGAIYACLNAELSTRLIRPQLHPSLMAKLLDQLSNLEDNSLARFVAEARTREPAVSDLL